MCFKYASQYSYCHRFPEVLKTSLSPEILDPAFHELWSWYYFYYIEYSHIPLQTPLNIARVINLTTDVALEFV